MSNFYGATSLIGGAPGALDLIDGAILSDLDGAVVITNDTTYIMRLDADNAGVESSPLIIAPDASPGDKRWVLNKLMCAGITLPDGGTIGQAAGPLLTFDDTLNYLEITGCRVGIGVATPLTEIQIAGSGLQSGVGPLYWTQERDGVAVLQFFGYSHDNVGLFFDAAHAAPTAGGGQWKSGHAGSNFGIYKTLNKFNFVYASGVAVGQELVWTIGMVMDVGGKVGIGTTTPVTKLTVEGAITLKEQAAADADTAAYGQIWVKNTTPNAPVFTDDAGKDGQFMLMRANSINASSDAADVQNCNVLWVDTSAGNVVLGGLANGIDNQLLYVLKYNSINGLTIEHLEATGTQKFMMDGADLAWNGVGVCQPFICKNGVWYIAAYPRSFTGL